VVGATSIPARATVIASPSIAALRNNDGRLEVFATNLSGVVAHRWQVTAGSETWSEWSTISGAPALTHIAAEANVDGLAQLWGTDIAGTVWRAAELSAGVNSWTSWSSVSGANLRSLAMARNINGLIEVWGTQSDGSIQRLRQTAANSTTWTSWQTVPGSLSSVAIKQDGNGHLVVWGVNSDGSVFRTTQTDAVSGTWPQLEATAGKLRPASISLATNGEGKLEAFGADDNYRVVHRVQIDAGADTWSDWSILTSSLTEVTGLAAQANSADGHIGLFIAQLSGLSSPSYYQMSQTDTGWTQQVTFDAFHNLPPRLNKPVLSGAQVGLSWTDKSDNEDSFDVYRRFGAGWQLVTHLATRNKGGTGDAYTFTDSTPSSNASARCYVAVSLAANGFTSLSDDLCVGDVSDPYDHLVAPVVSPLIAVRDRVTVHWTDRSSNETSFRVEKRGKFGSWFTAYTTPSNGVFGSGGTYDWFDFETAISGQCYRVIAINPSGKAPTAEMCTVRPDPVAFPQAAVGKAMQWDGLTSLNGGTGTLHSSVDGRHLYSRSRWVGPDLDFKSGVSSWKVVAEGGPQLMKGQAVALWTPGEDGGGGWMKSGGATFGAAMSFDQSRPSYEWRIVGAVETAGQPLNSGTFALWSNVRRDYLVFAPGTGPGVADVSWLSEDLDLAEPPAPDPVPQPALAHDGVGSLRVFNCVAAQHAVNVWIKDSTAGGDFQYKGQVAPQFDAETGCVGKDSSPLTFNPVGAHSYQVVVTDPLSTGCAGDDPSNNSCRVEDGTIVGSSDGAIETRTLGVGVERSRFAFNALRSTTPTVTGVSLTTAQSRLATANLKIGSVTAVVGQAAPGSVTVQGTSAGTELAINSPVDLTVTIGAPLSVDRTSNLSTEQGLAQAVALTASGGAQPYTWTVTGLPAGVSATSGVLAGVPNVAGIYTVSYTVADGTGATASSSFTWTVTRVEIRDFSGTGTSRKPPTAFSLATSRAYSAANAAGFASAGCEVIDSTEDFFDGSYTDDVTIRCTR